MTKKSSPRWLERCLLTGPFITLCTTPKAYHRACKHLGVAKNVRPQFMLHPRNGATAHFFESKKETYPAAIVCIRVDEGCSPVQVTALLVHEAVHIWQSAKEWHAETCPGKEVEAYGIQAIAQELLAEYARQTTPTK